MSEMAPLPCPWCGGDDVDVRRDGDGFPHYVRCFDCGARGPDQGVNDHAMSIDAWNRVAGERARAESAEKGERDV